MIVPDLNLLLYATISGFDHHEVARRWWEDLLSGSEGVGLVPAVALGYVRLTTGRRLLTNPMTVDESVGRVQSWLDQPNVHPLADSHATLTRALGLLRVVGAAGNLTTDAHIAAHALERNAVIATDDVDFARFPEARTVNPLTAPQAGR